MPCHHDCPVNNGRMDSQTSKTLQPPGREGKLGARKKKSLGMGKTARISLIHTHPLYLANLTDK